MYVPNSTVQLMFLTTSGAAFIIDGYEHYWVQMFILCDLDSMAMIIKSKIEI